MSSLADRLRGVVRREAAEAGPHDQTGPALRDDTNDRGGRLQPARSDALAETLEGDWQESRGQRYLVIDRSYGPGYRHGRMAIMDAMPPWPRLSLLAGPAATQDAPAGRLLFVDLETTGLAGGAGTLAFLVGCAWFDGPTLRVRQYFLPSIAAEPAFLDGIATLARGIGGVVTFNGKSFDLPLIETRFLFHRMDTPFGGRPHVDMLHPARRLWRAPSDDDGGLTGGCRLSALEQSLCGVEREGDVPGFEIPSRYFSYVRTGDARRLVPVLEHNRLDLVSLAMLTAHASRLLDEGPSAARSAREALGLGGLYERGGLLDDAREAYARAAGSSTGVGAGFPPPRANARDGEARRGDPLGRIAQSALPGRVAERPDLGEGGRRLDMPADTATRAEALRAYAVVCRRQRRFADAAVAWQRILDLRRVPVHIVREATEALAVHHEHRVRDLVSARAFALQSLRVEATAARQHAVHHRLSRLDRKLGARLSAPLFS